MYEVMMKMMIILMLVAIIVLPFQTYGSATFVISVANILFNIIAITYMRSKINKNSAS